MKIQRLFDEDELRELVEKTVRHARRTTPGNMCDEAIVQHAMQERFVDGRWRSMLFNEQHESAKALADLAVMFDGPPWRISNE
jgi:hypothetical protein